MNEIQWKILKYMRNPTAQCVHQYNAQKYKNQLNKYVDKYILPQLFNPDRILESCEIKEWEFQGPFEKDGILQVWYDEYNELEDYVNSVIEAHQQILFSKNEI